MRKQFTVFLILIFVLGLIPINFLEAITQNQIDAEVQIVCTDGADSWFSGSGTIIDPKGIILTNRHVIEGAYKNTCFIGFIESISQEPNFGAKGNYNLAEVKYYTTTSDMDAAILYLDNPTNKTYPYINIWTSNSDSLQFGDKVEAIGFPSIGGSTITYTSGDFSGFGSKSDGTQNYIKSTAQLEHGNSGGASYNSNGQFIGIPTMVVAGTLNSLSYILSVNSIKSWLSGIIGNQYQEEIIKQTPAPVKPTVSIQNDITPPNISKYKPIARWNTFIYYDLYDKNNETIKMAQPIDNEVIQTGSTNKIALFTSYSTDETSWNKTMGYDVVESESGLYSTFYRYSDNLTNLNNGTYEEFILKSDPFGRTSVTPIIDLPDKEGNYYLSLKFKDKAGNISNEYILTYVYLKEHYKKLKTINFYSDKNYKNLVGSYNMKFQFDGFDYLRCITKYNNIYIQWGYENNKEFLGSIARSFPDDMYALSSSDTTNNKNLSLITNNKLSIYNIGKSVKDDHVLDLKICENENDTLCNLNGKVTSLLIKPIKNNGYFFEGKNTVVKFHYSPNFVEEFKCGYPKTGDGYRNAIGEPNNYILVNSNAYPENASSNNIISNKLKGQILLQVEQNGEAYYVYPDDSKRYYLGRPDDAFSVMRKLGLGATHDFINSHTIYPTNVLGKILLDVEQNGEAYYIYPKDKKAYYLGHPADAFRIMRELGLGITNSDLNKIQEGSL
ncbi:MAG: S1C family serine protease [bacterium]|nr:S1C family serine protease [bacterium]